ncbi:MAG: hypothetical protein WC969_00690 [Elusimicrobiota bacterium]|jgi:hypothetical protein
MSSRLLTAVLLLVAAFGASGALRAAPSSSGLPASRLCLGYMEDRPQVRSAGIYRCRPRGKGAAVYELTFAAEDVGSDYFAEDGAFLVRCGEFGPPGAAPAACERIARLSCDRSRDLTPELCRPSKKRRRR